MNRHNIIELSDSNSDDEENINLSLNVLSEDESDNNNIDARGSYRNRKRSNEKSTKGKSKSNVDDDDNDDGDSDSSIIEVPESSPRKKSELDSSPLKSKLPSLNKKLNVQSNKKNNLQNDSKGANQIESDENDNQDNNENEENSFESNRERISSVTTKNILPSNSKRVSNAPSIAEQFKNIRSKYPHLPANTVYDAIRTKSSLLEIKKYLDGLPKSGYKGSTLGKKLTISKGSNIGRLSSLNSKKDRVILSSSPIRGSSNKKNSGVSIDNKNKLKLKNNVDERLRQLARLKAEKENVKSSKVILGSKSSIKDRFLSNRHNLSSKNADEILDIAQEESDSDSDSDDSLKEISHTTIRKKRKYEDEDDDYNPKITKLRNQNQNDQFLNSKDTNSFKKLVIDKQRIERAQNRAHKLQLPKLPEFEEDEDAGLDIEDKVLKLLNNADIKDIIDLANIKPNEAEIIVNNRKYNSMKDFLKLNLKPQQQASKKSRVFRPLNEKVVDTCKDKLKAYSAIDTLVKQCFTYSNNLTNEINKWGIDTKGQSVNGEMAITKVNISSDENNSDSFANEGKDNDDADDDGDDDDDELKVTKITKKRKIKFEDYGEDEDFGYSENKNFYKSSLDTSKVTDKIGYFKKSPKLLKEGVQLKDYQQVGINWINLLFQKQLSCILADEMGLGKTIQVIAFLSHLKEKKYPGPHLIVVPSSTLENWLREFEKFAPTIDVVPYYGSLDDREELRSVLIDEEFDVMITTYNLATVGKLDQPFLRSFHFNCIVYDEGHMLKNATSDRYKKLTKLRAHFRLLLTGTPLQNNLKELVSLLDFILPEVFTPKMSQLELLFDKKATTKVENQRIEGESYNPLLSQQAIAKAKIMMAPFILRRTKAQVMKDLSKKHSNIEYCQLSINQRLIYDSEIKSYQLFRKEMDSRKGLSDDQIKKLPPLKGKKTNMLMALRKACLHPLLFRFNYSNKMLKIMSKEIMKNDLYLDANREFIYEDMQVMSDFELTQLCHKFPNELGKFVLKQNSFLASGKVEKLVSMVKKIVEKGEKVLVFSLFTQMLDILEKVLSINNWKFVRLDGSTPVETRQDIIDTFYEDKTIPIMLLSTKAGGFGINLICASHVIIFDQSFNPHDDKQAEDRAHRVGQTKEVHVTRLICNDSIEENILELAYNKLQLDQSMMKQPVEDILLKTVEDIIQTKDVKMEVDSKQDNSTIDSKDIKLNEKLESAFEENIDLLTEEHEEDEDDIQEIKSEIKSEIKNESRSSRRRDVKYSEDIGIKEFLESDDEKKTGNESDHSDYNDSNSPKKKQGKKSAKSKSPEIKKLQETGKITDIPKQEKSIVVDKDHFNTGKISNDEIIQGKVKTELLVKEVSLDEQNQTNEILPKDDVLTEISTKEAPAAQKLEAIATVTLPPVLKELAPSSSAAEVAPTSVEVAPVSAPKENNVNALKLPQLSLLKMESSNHMSDFFKTFIPENATDNKDKKDS